jgi:hypothetical protein
MGIYFLGHNPKKKGIKKHFVEPTIEEVNKMNHEAYIETWLENMHDYWE